MNQFAPATDDMAIDIPPQGQEFVHWYSTGQSRTLEIHGLLVTVRFVGRKGRRGRIAISGISRLETRPVSNEKSKRG